MSCSSDDSTITVDKRNYPRTGKRGVPQTFPRKLHIMLEAESKEMIVHWSNSGRAFHIADVSLFSKEVLPKYFKTSKFSSFQRNLNLYGFTKIRKGPEIDMYFHPRFIRGDEDGLSQIRKRTKAPGTKNQASSSLPSHVHHPTGFSIDFQHYIRVVSPTISPNRNCGNAIGLFKHGPSHDMRNSERLSMLADAMIMMLGEN
mmetsp:Transcript_38974/g.81929  ORF Transcript_38974/g.81929 Transcript_38974/m.81929 type:complete len:201 (-) Transcript_38974:136-738(-)